VTLHRLNRAEYNNTVRDLLGTSLRPADDFPADDRGYGYDNIADVLSVSPLHIEMYQAAAETLIEEALGSVAVPTGGAQIEAETATATTGAAAGTAWNLYSEGEVSATITLPASGDYRFSVRAWARQAGPDLAQMSINIDGTPLRTLDVPATSDAPATYDVEAMIGGGTHTLSVAFLNDYYVSATMEDRNLYVDWMRWDGPLGVMPSGGSARDRIMVCDPATTGHDECADDILRGFAYRAWRRPPTDAEVDRLREFVTLAEGQGDDFETGIRLALQATLLSPHFIYRVEIDPAPTSLEPHLLTDFELASRLSYFIWSSMPDDELLAAADAGLLRDPSEIEAQALRMLDDPKARALVDNFAGQGLFTRDVAEVAPDYMLFPTFDDELREAMRLETETFFQSFLEDDLPVTEMLTADWGFVNDRLAEHYGMTPPGSTTPTRVTLPADRRGLLGQGSVLTVTSHAARTSIVKRGRWILEQLLCEPPPPPPPGVDTTIDTTGATGTLRERMEAHRANPTCAGCHSRMDPLGFALEHFDAVGAWRELDNGEPIDATGTLLPQGADFDGAVELSGALAEDPRFPACVTRQLYTYALGRGPELSDDPYLQRITEGFASDGYQLRALIVGIVTSDPFRMRHGEEE
jgi:hypothetical protein